MKSSERGSALLEFGLIATVLFTLIFGIIDFGRALFAYHYVANTAREGTRLASVRGYDCLLPDYSVNGIDMGCGMPLERYFKAQAAGTGLDPNQLTVNEAPFYDHNYPALYPAICDPSSQTGIPNSPGCTVQVIVNYRFQFIFPLLPALPVNISNTSTAVITQ